MINDLIGAVMRHHDDALGVRGLAKQIYESSPIFQDIPWMPVNQSFAHRSMWREGTSFGAMHDYVGRVTLIHKLKTENGEVPESKDGERACMREVGERFADMLFYGDSGRTYSSNFTGFAPRFNTVNPDRAHCAVNVFDAGSRNQELNSSIWVIRWDAEKLFVGYPPSTVAGLKSERIGHFQEWSGEITDPFNANYPYGTKLFEVMAGLVVADWKRVYRIANIDEDHVEPAMLRLRTLQAMHSDAMVYMPEWLHKRLPPGADKWSRWVNSQKILARLRCSEPRVV